MIQLLPVEGSQLEPVQNFAFWKSLFRVSFSVAPVLSEGPLLVTVSRYVRFVSVIPGLGDAVLVNARFALAGPATVSWRKHTRRPAIAIWRWTR